MTDLELTKVCAEAMGLTVISWNGTLKLANTPDGKLDLDIPYETYKPLHDDAQAMALVKKFRLDIHQPISNVHGKWGVVDRGNAQGPQDTWQAWNKDLNRAIVECVAKLKERP